MRLTWKLAALLSLAAAAAIPPAPAQAEVKEVRVAKGFGIGYLPLLVMEHEQLYEKHAKAAGLTDSVAKWIVFDGGANQATMLIGGNLEVSSGGLGPLITLWSRTREQGDIRGMASINSMPLYLNTRNPDVKTIKDFTEKDRIALPVVKTSIQAVVLQMAAEKAFGKHDQLDQRTTALSHPDGTTALLSGATEITAHLTAPPFQHQQLKDPKIRRVFSSYDVVGGPHTFNLIWTTAKFRTENPKAYGAFLAGLKEAIDKINADKKAYAKMFVETQKSRLTPEFVEEIMVSPEVKFTMAPEGVAAFAAFMNKVGSIKILPKDWKDVFFPEVHNLPGN